MDPSVEAFVGADCMPAPTGLPESVLPLGCAHVLPPREEDAKQPEAKEEAKMGTPKKIQMGARADQEAQGYQLFLDAGRGVRSGRALGRRIVFRCHVADGRPKTGFPRRRWSVCSPTRIALLRSAPSPVGTAPGG